MTRLQGRLQRLEASVTDEQGLIPGTPRWLEYWMTQMDRLIAGEALAQRIPLEAFDAIMAEARSQREGD